MTSTTPGSVYPSAAVGRRGGSAEDLEAWLARQALGAWRKLRSGAPALTFMYLVLIWAIFAGVLLAIPGGGLGARAFTGLSGL